MNKHIQKRKTGEQYWADIWPKATVLTGQWPASLGPAHNPDGRDRPMPA
jgi:hypothetical protein